MQRRRSVYKVVCLLNFNQSDSGFDAELPAGRWRKIFDSAEKIWHGPGNSLPDDMEGNVRVSMKRHSLAV